MMHMLAQAAHCNECAAWAFYTDQPMRRQGMNRGQVRILVVDDEPRHVGTVPVNLEARGYEVLVVEDGHKAVELAASAEPDLIILDVKGPGLDGCEVCERIREFSTVPIIMLITPTGNADKVIRSLYAGADHCMTRPFSVAELMARMRAVLRRAGLSRRKGLQPTFQPEISRVFLPNGDLRSVFAQRGVPIVD